MRAKQRLSFHVVRYLFTTVWAFHGAKDELVPINQSQSLVDALKAVGGDVRFSVLADRDHFILDVYEDKQLYEWFLQHRRKASSFRQ